MPCCYQIERDGIYCTDDQGRHRVCEAPVEVVTYSSLDDALYLRWPSDDGYHHMVTVPGRMLDEDDYDNLTARLNGLGLSVDKEQGPNISRYLRREIGLLRR